MATHPFAYLRSLAIPGKLLRRHATHNTEYRAAGIIIGNEVLSGKTHDTNSHVLAQRLFENGIRLCRIETIPDLIPDIVNTVKNLSRKFDYVFTSGGIGSTHDDITYKAISTAFGLTLELHHPTLEAMTAHYLTTGKLITDVRLRMATLPSPPDRIINTPNLWVPAVQCRNVFILPGIPLLFEQMLKSVLAIIDHGKKLVRISLIVEVGETEIADSLEKVQEDFPNVEIGSYPKTTNSSPFQGRTQLCFTSSDSQAAKDALAAFKKTMEYAIVPEDGTSR